MPCTARPSGVELYRALAADSARLEAAGVRSVRRIGDCYGPATIAAAVYEGHRFARELDAEVDPDAVPFLRESYRLEDAEHATGARRHHHAA
jgi:dimethylamine/trimethylamine dehydrogenase